MNALDPKSARSAALRLVRGQVLITLVIAGLFLIWSDARAAMSALMGGGIGVAAGLAMVGFMFRAVPGDDPRGLMRNVYKGEAAKLGVTVLLFVVALKYLKLAALPLFVAYIATLLMHWVALMKSR
jgi:ATP synthase protein I